MVYPVLFYLHWFGGDNNSEKVDPLVLKKIKWFIQAWDGDYPSLPNAELHCLFHKLNIKHEFRVNDGIHDGDCLNRSKAEGLKFINNALLLSTKWLGFK